MVGLAVLWPLAAEGYDGLVVRLALVPRGIVLRATEDQVRVEFLGQAPVAWLNIHGFIMHFGLILVLALVAATPGLALPRLALGVAATAVLAPVAHALGLTAWLWALSAALGAGASLATFERLMTGFAVFWGVVPIVVGGVWCYRFWLPALRREPVRALRRSGRRR